MPLTKVQAGMVEATGTPSASTFLRGDGAWATPVSITSGTAVTASGTSVDFTGIPAGVKRITVMFSGVSTNGSSVLLAQLGTSSGIETSSYAGNTWQGNTLNSGFGSGFNFGTSSTAASAAYGNITLALLGSNTWVLSGVIGRLGAVDCLLIAGSKTLSGTLDRVRITTVNGTDTFDAGTINIMYET